MARDDYYTLLPQHWKVALLFTKASYIQPAVDLLFHKFTTVNPAKWEWRPPLCRIARGE